jgi:YVTN family beta-propeller protein
VANVAAVNSLTNKIYVSNYESDNITLIDGATNSLTTITDPNAVHPGDVALNPLTNKIYVVNGGTGPYAGSNNITVVDGATNSITTVRDPNATQSNWVAVNSSTNKIYVANWGSNNVTVIDGATNSTTTVTDPNAIHPNYVGVNPATNRIYVANGGGFPYGGSNNVTVIDGAGKAGPALTLTPASLTFPAQPVGSFSPAQFATLTNTGATLLKITSIGPSGDFYEGNNCPGTLVSGASCKLSVKFTPTSAGVKSGAVTIWDNAPGSPHKLTLSGSGSGGRIMLQLSPSSLSFGSVTIGTTSTPQTVTLKNTGTVAASFLDPFGFGTTVTIPGTNQRDFEKNPWRCGTSLAPHASCKISVYFKPLAAGTRSAYFFVRQGAASVQIQLSGTGL